MKLVIDANVIMSMLIKPGLTIDLFFLEELEIFAPNLLFEELERNKGIIIAKSSLDEEDIENLFLILKKKITVVAEKNFISYRKSAEGICLDSKDIAYFALSLHLKCPLWTNEKRLQKQEIIKVYPTHELMKLFGL